jgi:predicted AAA+ superfamily ATPase
VLALAVGPCVRCRACAALPFITNQKNGKFVVEAEAKNLLASIKGRLAIVVVAGPYRTGKSYLLNKLVNAQKGFNVYVAAVC